MSDSARPQRFWVLETASAVASALWLALHPSTWARPTRDVLSRQILFTGVDALGFTALIAVLVGLSVVLQAQLWLGKLGQSELLGPMLVTVLVREVCPLMANFIVIGRSGTAIATEMATIAGDANVIELELPLTAPELTLRVRAAEVRGVRDDGRELRRATTTRERVSGAYWTTPEGTVLALDPVAPTARIEVL